ncbi:hypothetical protein OPU71_14250 [Niveibacterium sp. 24ML]|uniref:hypothetical protein n=1 Tax=Niveibacterium sp. 24ML TaxID=2985512 RepID=UPI00226E9D31|nr:hypothetical protein [Niveibacterium sp. 24ML]MCX9157286.1 hypothetical protein [Niveibacterium sp. 24ML]
MKLTDVRTAIYARLSEALKPHSFKLNKGQEAFVRAIPQGRQSVYISIVDLEPAFEFSVVIGLRADPVEEIAHLFSGAPEKYQKLSETAIVQLSYFTGREETAYLVSSTQDINSATSAVSTVLFDAVLPVLEECKTISALEERVNSPQRNFNTAQPPYALLTSLALAALANSNAFESLAFEAINVVARYPASEREKVAQLIEYVRAKRRAHDVPTT